MSHVILRRGLPTAGHATRERFASAIITVRGFLAQLRVGTIAGNAPLAAVGCHVLNTITAFSWYEERVAGFEEREGRQSFGDVRHGGASSAM